VSVFNKKYPPGSVLRCSTAAENGVMTKGFVFGGFDLRLWRITWSPSQTLRRRLVRTTDTAVCSTLAAVRRGFVFHTSRLVRLTTVWTCMQRSQIFVKNRVFCLPHLHSTPPLSRFPSECRHPVWHGETRMAWLPDGEKISKISLFVLTQLTKVTDRHTDTHIPHDARQKERKKTNKERNLAVANGMFAETTHVV